MPKAFDPTGVEERLYQFWQDGGFFTPRVDDSREPFTIVIPPPNVTGELHHGHAMFVAFQDLIIRYRRMLGRNALWLPGADHAGIATQTVVERELAKEGLTRQDIGRERFVERVWQWKEVYGGRINNQLRRLGASCDWTRERFTMDAGLSRAVRVAFVRLYNRGLIYRGTRMINWCPRCRTALSDLEVEHQDVATKLYYVHYPLVPLDGETAPAYISVATTRPETILGDTAVVVNPDDPRYTALIGRLAVLPALGRRIPIIADAVVDPRFGTGAVKVTPAHDPTDYEIGQRHHLMAINVISEDGRMNDAAGPYAGLDRLECRRRLLADLERDGLLVKVEDYTHSVGHCDRCGTVVEPSISEQWFVKIEPLAKPAMEAVRDGRIRFIPERFGKVYLNWMENIRDWCISRQLWWGHRIPVWYCGDRGHLNVVVDAPTKCAKCGSTSLVQDEDVLDTWFSSGLWPFSTLGWPDDTADLRYFYPTNVMETGYDILPLWVSRMIMLGIECMGDVPFRQVYLHGLLRDSDGKKMSKSKGNVANPLDVVAKYGTDALRFTILTGSSPGNDMKLSEDKLEGSRNFVNKLWNAARFVVTTAREDYAAAMALGQADPRLTLADRWILSRCSRVIADVTRLFEEFEFSEAGHMLHEFVWSEFCDWFIEIAKLRLRGDADRIDRLTALHVLDRVLTDILKMLHPFAPYVTEAIWEYLPGRPSPLIIAAWPTAGETDAAAEIDIDLLTGIVKAIRNARTEMNVEPARRIEAIAVSGGSARLLEGERAIVAALARVEPYTVVEALLERPHQALQIIVGDVEIYLPLAAMLDIAAETERLEGELAGLSGQVDRLRARLADAGFTSKAPAAIVEKERGRLAEFADRADRLRARLAALTG
jgi:valyl-tRNA synthetase